MLEVRREDNSSPSGVLCKAILVQKGMALLDEEQLLGEVWLSRKRQTFAKPTRIEEGAVGSHLNCTLRSIASNVGCRRLKSDSGAMKIM